MLTVPLHSPSAPLQGITGTAGTNGWFVRFNQGAPPFLKVFITQLPPWASMVFATRYPAGTTFTIRRVFEWYPALSTTVTQVKACAYGQAWWLSFKSSHSSNNNPTKRICERTTLHSNLHGLNGPLSGMPHPAV